MAGTSIVKKAHVLGGKLAKTAFWSLVVFGGFAMFQVLGWLLYCSPPFQWPLGSERPWCATRVPVLYSFVQEFYWNCGFLSYYEMKQLPNFLLAAPMVALSIWGIGKYVRQDFDRACLWQLDRFRSVSKGLSTQQNGASGEPGPDIDSTAEDVLSETSTSSAGGDVALSDVWLHNDYILPHVYLWAFMLLYCVTSMHIQVISRFFSSMPCVYWFVASEIISAVSGREYPTIGRRSSDCDPKQSSTESVSGHQARGILINRMRGRRGKSRSAGRDQGM